MKRRPKPCTPNTSVFDKEVNNVKIILNQKETEVADGTNVAELMKEQKMSRAMVKINDVRIRPADYEATVVQDGDKVVLRRVVAGG